MRANVEARRGSMTATATSVSWRDDPHREQHAYEAVPERDAQEHEQEDDQAGRDRRFARRSIDGVVLRAQLEQLMEEAEIDA